MDNEVTTMGLRHRCPMCGKTRHGLTWFTRCMCSPRDLGRWMANRHLEITRRIVAAWANERKAKGVTK